MSVKLPNINSKEPEASSPQQLQNSKKSIESISPQQQEELAYENNASFESVGEPSPRGAPETLTVLKGQSEPQPSQLTVEVVQKEELIGKQSQVSKQNRQQLLQILNQKTKEVADLRQNIEDKKKEIKSIGDQIDKDLNKSLLKASKNTVNIRDIFSAAPKTNNQNVNQLNLELKQTRFAIKKIKGDIQKAQDGLADPVNLLNQDRGHEFKTKMKYADSQLKTIEHEKELLEVEIQRGGKQFNEEEEKQKSQEMSKLSQQLHEILLGQKQQKSKLYLMQKEDIILMEKIKFFQEKEGHIGVRKAKPAQKDKQKVQQQIKNLIISINQTLEQRNKTELEKRHQTKLLSQEIASLESKNWELYNKLREVDAYLLQYYEKKTRKKQVKNLEKTIDVMEKSVSGKIEAQTILQTPKKSKFSDNDKNVTAPLVEKKKNYQFGSKQQLKDQINLCDEFLGQKLNVKTLTIKFSKDKLLFLQAKYLNNLGNDIQGLIMGSKKLPEDVESMQITLQKDEIINFIHTGHKQDNCLAFLHVVTSEGKQMKWGSLENSSKNEQKHIKKYQSSLLKAKLLCFQQQDSSYSAIAGMTFITTFLAPK